MEKIREQKSGLIQHPSLLRHVATWKGCVSYFRETFFPNISSDNPQKAFRNILDYILENTATANVCIITSCEKIFLSKIGYQYWRTALTSSFRLLFSNGKRGKPAGSSLGHNHTITYRIHPSILVDRL